MVTTLDIIEKKERSLEPLYKRFRQDEKKAHNEAYQMLRADNVTTVDNIVNVTMNYPSTFAGDLSYLIQTAQMQVVVEGKRGNRDLTPDEKKVLETFGELHFAMIDDLLVRRMIGKMMAYLAGHICVRGWIAGRYMAYKKDGKYVADFMPWDMLYTAYEGNDKGKTWASYRSWRSKELLQKEYPKVNFAGEDLIEVVHFLDDEWQEVWIDKERIKRESKNTNTNFLSPYPKICFL